ncbi:MAG: glycosyltransferase family 9 protein [Candidatus Omnitrophica bacterium]|nr:glycosyltransferase family 9 protein [Candidatus Omnitrophota bacterium]
MDPVQYKRILIIRTDRLGDLVLTTPVFKALREAYPGAYIVVMTKPDTALVLKNNPHINEVIIYDKDGEYKSMFANIRFAMALRKKKFDLAIVLDPANRTHFLAYLAGIPRRIGYDEDFAFLLTDRIKNTRHEGMKYEAEYNLDLLTVLGIRAQEAYPRIFVDKGAEAVIDDLLSKNKISPGDKFILLHPGASCPSKRWPAERFAWVADALASIHGVKIVVFSGEDKSAISCIEDVKNHMVHCLSRMTAARSIWPLRLVRLLLPYSAGTSRVFHRAGGGREENRISCCIRMPAARDVLPTTADQVLSALWP